MSNDKQISDWLHSAKAVHPQQCHVGDDGLYILYKSEMETAQRIMQSLKATADALAAALKDSKESNKEAMKVQAAMDKNYTYEANKAQAYAVDLLAATKAKERLFKERDKLHNQIQQSNRDKANEQRLAAEKELKADTERRTRAQEAIDLATKYGFKSDDILEHYSSVGMQAIRFMADRLRRQSNEIKILRVRYSQRDNDI
jgi:hypothetical protein